MIHKFARHMINFHTNIGARTEAFNLDTRLLIIICKFSLVHLNLFGQLLLLFCIPIIFILVLVIIVLFIKLTLQSSLLCSEFLRLGIFVRLNISFFIAFLVIAILDWRSSFISIVFPCNE